jgi:hypothetical protein
MGGKITNSLMRKLPCPPLRAHVSTILNGDLEKGRIRDEKTGVDERESNEWRERERNRKMQRIVAKDNDFGKVLVAFIPL